ncbi:serine/threonine-protein kinase [Actinoplanes sp. NPDC051411]|uniref:serine/threonine-protein kinase n=1 Tax=unclassified Actinoplanes TaxID=2626549 RepID=UPI003436BB85
MRMLAGRYAVGDELARGGMAVVHRAVDTVLRRTVAVKILMLERSHSYRYRDAVRQEALSGARLSHPNVARVFDYGEAEQDGRYLPFVVMELVAGETLTTRLGTAGPMSWRDAAAVCADVASALAAAHEHDVVHRDVKPSNIMLSAAGAKLVDFGLSAPTGASAIDFDGRIPGTPSYFAPEQFHALPVSPAADVYALGLVLHACLAGRPAWTGGVDSVLVARACSPTPRLPEWCEVPPEVSSIYRRCLAREPKKRPPAGRVAHLLRQACAPSSPARSGSRTRMVPRRLLPVSG